MSVSIFVNAPPPRATAQQKGVFVVNGKPRFFTKARQKRESQNTVAILLDRKPANFSPLEGPLVAVIRMVWPYRKSESRRVVANGIEMPMPVRPDCDNLAKSFCDALMAAGYLAHDDAQITTLKVVKRWGPSGYWKIDLTPDGESKLF